MEINLIILNYRLYIIVNIQYATALNNNFDLIFNTYNYEIVLFTLFLNKGQENVSHGETIICSISEMRWKCVSCFSKKIFECDFLVQKLCFLWVIFRFWLELYKEKTFLSQNEFAHILNNLYEQKSIWIEVNLISTSAIQVS